MVCRLLGRTGARTWQQEPDLIDVGLVNLIRQQYKLLLSSKLYEILEVLIAQTLASGVARVDEDKSPDCQATVPALLKSSPQIINAHTPALLFLQVVAKQ